MRFAIFLITFCSSLVACAQDLSKDLAAMYRKLDGLKAYRLSVSYTAGDTSDLFDEGIASVLVCPQGYFYQTDFAEMIINREHTILVNEAERTLIYSDNEKSSSKDLDMSELILQGIDTLIASADSVYFSLNGKERTYHLRFSNKYFDIVELIFTGDYLSRANYFYNEKLSDAAGSSAMCKMSVEEQPVYESQLLKSDFYFTGHGEKAIPTQAFTGYVLIYNTSLNLTK